MSVSVVSSSMITHRAVFSLECSLLPWRSVCHFTQQLSWKRSCKRDVIEWREALLSAALKWACGRFPPMSTTQLEHRFGTKVDDHLRTLSATLSKTFSRPTRDSSNRKSLIWAKLVQHRTEHRDIWKLVEASRLPVGNAQSRSDVLQEQYWGLSK